MTHPLAMFVAVADEYDTTPESKKNVRTILSIVHGKKDRDGENEDGLVWEQHQATDGSSALRRRTVIAKNAKGNKTKSPKKMIGPKSPKKGATAQPAVTFMPSTMPFDAPTDAPTGAPTTTEDCRLRVLMFCTPEDDPTTGCAGIIFVSEIVNITYEVTNLVTRNPITLTSVERKYTQGSNAPIMGKITPVPNPIAAAGMAFDSEELPPAPNEVGMEVVVFVNASGMTSLGLTCNAVRTLRLDIVT